ncbi:MAG: tRNA (adenosine(37)-N6)-threonylcarbamoyltransferase complex ATPase subunit type 1 TsaE [Acidobacteriota bacterium]
MEWLCQSEEETRRVGELLAPELSPAGILLLTGDLGAGKTVLAQGIGRGLGIDPAEIQSPTYTLVREHRGSRGGLVHLDLYRLEAAEVADLGIEEILAGPAVKVVEWPDRLPFPVSGARHLMIEKLAPTARRIASVTE